MKRTIKILFAIMILASTLGVAGPLKYHIESSPLPEPVQMLLVGICLLLLAGYGRRKLYKR